MNPFKGKGLKSEHFNQEVNYIIENFLVEQSITMLYAPPKQGKSRLALGLASYLLESTDHEVMYFDFDNPISALSERGVDKVAERGGGKFDYIHPEVAGMESFETLNELVKHATPRAYKGWVFFFDSVTDFTNENDDSASKKFMHKVKALRNAGATVILLHHSNKNEKGYKGSSVLRSAVDNMYLVNLVSFTKGYDLFTLEAEAPRFTVSNVAFSLNNSSYAISPVEYQVAMITPIDKSIIDEVTKTLKLEKDGLGQSELLKAMGKEKNDKQYIRVLQQYVDRFWKLESGKNRKKIYKLQ